MDQTADRLMVKMACRCGRRAGQRASDYVRQVAPRTLPERTLRVEQARVATLMSSPGPERAWQLREELGKALSQNLGIFRTRASMASALETVRDLQARAGRIVLQDHGQVFNSDVIQAFELDALLDVAETIVVGGLAREESRGAHYRGDFPHRDDVNWLKHTLAYRTAKGPRLGYAPITITRFQPK